MTTRFFNTAGPVDCNRHYCLPPLERFKLPEVLRLIEQQKYFVLHAPRQTGKTTYLLALMSYLNDHTDYRCLYINVEVAQSARQDVRRGIKAILSQVVWRAETILDDPYPGQIWADVFAENGEDAALNNLLALWSRHSAKPLILLIDEIDSLIGDTLIAVLRQLRAGYDSRPQLFPQTIMLCGVRDVKDYRIQSSKDEAIITGGSAFNIKAKSLRLGNFNRLEIETLCNQHRAETGQSFTAEALEMIWQLTAGQPWLVNALAYETCFEITDSQDRRHPITPALITEAKERIIQRRETHIDQLIDKLSEPRVRRVIEPILAGQDSPDLIPSDDISYVRDLGLIQTDNQLTIANRIYQEVIPRELTYSTQLTITHQSLWYLQSDNRLDINKLLIAFQEFFREHSEYWLERFTYREAGPQLLLQAFLQRIINSGGRIEREYGLGRKRTDLLIRWPYQTGWQKIVLELKLVRSSLEETIKDGVAQTWQYMDLCGTDEGHLVLFDQRKRKTWNEKIFRRQERYAGIPIIVWGM